MSAQPASLERERKKPGRKAETPLQRLQRLEKDLAAARRAVAEAEQQRLVAIGQAVIAEANSNPSFMNQLREVLHSRVTTKSGRAELSALLDAPSPTGQASS